MNPLDTFYAKQEEPLKSCLVALKQLILAEDSSITHELKYGMPFFSFNGKMFCYLWFHKKYHQPYIGMVEGKLFNEKFLIQEKRARMKIMLLNADEDLPVDKIRSIVKKALHFYRDGS